MHTVSIREVRERISDLVTEVLNGETVMITRRGKQVIKMVSAAEDRPGRKGFPSLAEFRDKQKVKGRSISQEVVAMRDEERS